MQQTAPKFMAQVKARFVAPGSAEHASSPQKQGTQNRQNRVPSGNFSSNKLNANQMQNSGSLSHRQMQVEPIQPIKSASNVNKGSNGSMNNNNNNQASDATQGASGSQKHHISLQKLMQQENTKKREMLGMRASHDEPFHHQMQQHNNSTGSNGNEASHMQMQQQFDRQSQVFVEQSPSQPNLVHGHHHKQHQLNHQHYAAQSSSQQFNQQDIHHFQQLQHQQQLLTQQQHYNTSTPQMLPVMVDMNHPNNPQQQQQQSQVLLMSHLSPQAQQQYKMHMQQEQQPMHQSQQLMSNIPSATMTTNPNSPVFTFSPQSSNHPHHQLQLTSQHHSQQYASQKSQGNGNSNNLLMGYNTGSENTGFAVDQQNFMQQQQQQSLSPAAANSIKFELIDGINMSGKRQPNFQMNKQSQQQKVQGFGEAGKAALIVGGKQKTSSYNRGPSSSGVVSDAPNGGRVQNKANVTKQSKMAGANNNSASSMHRPPSGNHSGKPSAQVTANLNLMKQLYSAKGGVQTPPANFKGSSSSVGSRRQSGESSGMISMGSIGSNFNEGSGDVVQRPLVREFKTQGRLNRGIMPTTNSHEQQQELSNKNSNSHHVRRTNATVTNFAKKQSPNKASAISSIVQSNIRSKANQKHVSQENSAPASKDTIIVTPVNLSQNNNIAAAKEKPSSTPIHSARLVNNKKFKSMSESNVTGPLLKSNKLKGGLAKKTQQLQQQLPIEHQQPQTEFSPSFIPNPQQNNHMVNMFDRGNSQTSENNNNNEAPSQEHQQFLQPQQPLDDLSPPDLNFKSQSFPLHNSEEVKSQNNISNISPNTQNKQSFQQSSNQDAIEKNEELMSLLACLNEQAINELNTQDENEWDTGMQRLLKAYKILVETKNPNSFDANYKAIICYNLACCCQMQSQLQDCSKYLSKAIEFVAAKLVSLKEQAISHYNQNTNTTNNQSTSNQHNSQTLEQPSLTITNTSITNSTAQKNSDLFDRNKRGTIEAQRNNKETTAIAAVATRGGKNMIANTRNSQAQLQSYRGSRYSGAGKQTTSQQQFSRNQNVVGQRKQNSMKSPMRAGDKTRTNHQTASRIQGGSQTSSNLLFSEFSRQTNNTNQKQKVSQQSLRTISINANNQVKQRGIGSTGTKNAQSQAQFMKPGSNSLFNGGTPHTRTSKLNTISEQKKREAKLVTAAQQTQIVQVDNPNKTRENKQKKKQKVSIKVENWLECYVHAKNRPPREILERSIHLTRFFAQFVLQLCAVLSQLQEHEQALLYSKQASRLASELTEMTLILIKDEVKPQKSAQDNSGIGDTSTQKPKRRKHSTQNQIDPYNTSLSKQKTTASARFNYGTKGHNSQNSSLVQSHLNQASKEGKVSQSYTMSNFNQLAAKEQSSAALNNSGLALSYFPNPEQIKNERESLERIHTFSLKEPIDFNGSDDQIGAQTLTNNLLDPLLGNGGTDRTLRNDGEHNKQNLSMEAPFSSNSNRQRGISEGSRNSSTTSNRSCSQYVPEKVQIFQKQIKKTHDTVDELIKIQKEFFQISDLNFRDRRDYFQDRMAEKKKLKISFQTFEEMNKLQIEQKFKITARSALGVKNYSTDDWIFSFNIGNIMHLQTMGFDELANAKTTQSMMKGDQNKPNSHALSKAGIQGSVTTQQGIRNYLMSEISKDNLLYKALYVIVSYFCIGTELRFLATLSPQKYSLKDSEIWHAKAIHIASYFLPNDCPLIQHITQSYAKHHLRPKIKRRQDQLASLANYNQ